MLHRHLQLAYIGSGETSLNSRFICQESISITQIILKTLLYNHRYLCVYDAYYASYKWDMCNAHQDSGVCCSKYIYSFITSQERKTTVIKSLKLIAFCIRVHARFRMIFKLYQNYH